MTPGGLAEGRRGRGEEVEESVHGSPNELPSGPDTHLVKLIFVGSSATGRGGSGGEQQASSQEPQLTRHPPLSAAGKTALIRRLFTDKFESHQPPTVGVVSGEG